MKQTTIAQGFKLKNKLINEITELKAKIRRNNSYKKGTVIHYDVKELYSQLAEKKALLIDLKSKIIAANVKVYPKIYELAELKDQVDMLKSIPTQEGKELRSNYGSEPIEEEWVAIIPQPKIDSEILKLEEKIEGIQDELDQHNFTTPLLPF